MLPPMTASTTTRTRWAAIGAAVAIVLGAGGIATVRATVGTGTRTVYVPITPCRLFDTRPAPDTVGPRSTPLGRDETHTVTAHGTSGNCTIPTDAVALAINVTSLGATLPTFLTLWASDVDRPAASHLNPAPGAPPTPNAVTTNLSPTNQFNFYNRQGSVDVFADVVGYYADHHHDDRYYTKAQTDTLVGSGVVTRTLFRQSIVWEQPSAVVEATSNECVQNTTISGVYVYVPLEMPVGARLMSVSALVLDHATTTSYTVNVRRATITTSGTTFANLFSSPTLGGSAGPTVTSWTPTTTEIVTASTDYYVRIGSFQNTSNGFCSLTYTYDETP